MRKILILVAAALTLALLLPAKADARHSLAHRVSALETKVGAVQKKVNALHTFAHSCLAADWVPIGWYGDFQAPFGEFGYEWKQPDASVIYTTAIDIAPTPDETFFYTVSVNPNCLSQVAARVSGLRRQASALADGLRAHRALR